MRFSLLILLALSLTGCNALLNPAFLPTSYAYNQSADKSASGSHARTIGYEYSEEKNASVLTQWRIVTDDFLTQIEEQTGLAPTTVYLHDTLKDSAFNNSFDFALRESLRAKGYTLENAAGVFDVRLIYEAIPHVARPIVNVPIISDLANAQVNKTSGVPYADFDLKMQVFTGGVPPMVVARAYTLPTFGYHASSFVEAKEKRVKEARTRAYTLAGERDWNE